MLYSLLHLDPKCTVLKHFDIQDMASLANRYSNVFPRECLIKTEGHYPWRPDKARTEPTMEWIKLLWRFLLECTRDLKGLSPVRDWQIIPSNRPSLFSLANAKTTFSIEPRVSRRVLDILNKLGCPFVNGDLLGRQGLDILHSSLASPVNSKDVITVLGVLMNEGRRLEGILNDQECTDLLLHLQRDICDIRQSHRLVDTLKSLPVYQTLDGAQISIYGVREILVLETSVPKSPFTCMINTLLHDAGCVVLRRHESLLALYKVLGVKTVSQVTLHTQHVLPAFSHLRTSKERILYMTYIKDQILPSLPYARPDRYQLLTRLSSTAFIPNIDGELVTADKFYIPFEPLFVIAKDHVDFIQFPPRPYCGEAWIDFLADVGLQTNMHPSRYLQCVKTVEEQFHERRYVDTSSLEQLAEALVTYMFKQEHYPQDVLEEVSWTRFMPCHRASKYLTDIYPSAGKKTTCFRGSVTSDQESLVWTTSMALPEWASPPTDHLKKVLGVQNSPTLADVIDNCINICSKVGGGDVDRNVRCIMQRIYQFLQESCSKSPSHCFENTTLLPEKVCGNCHLISRKLTRIPCVIVEVGSSNRFSVGVKVVFGMSNEDRSVFGRHLFRLFRKLAPYESLFRCLGATQNVTLAKYAHVLNELVHRYGSDTVLGEDTIPWKTACAAVGRIVELSCGEDGPEEWYDFKSQTSQPILYLPTEQNTLVPSQDIVIIESKDYDPSIVKNLDKNVLTPWLRLSQVAVESIPEDLRPVFLSDITDEQMSARSTPCKDGQECPFLAFYATTFQDQRFSRLLALAISVRGKFADKSELIPKVRAKLADIELHCYNTIELQQINIQNEGILSRKGKEMLVYLSVKSSGDGSNSVNMYLKHGANSGGSAHVPFNIQLARALCDVFKEYHMDLESVLEEVMKLQPTTDTLDVVRYDSLQRTQDVFPLGSSCTESRVSHRPDIEFEEGEIVAYRLPSAGQQEHIFHAIFGKVVKEEKVDELNKKEDGAIESGEELALQTQTSMILDFERIFEVRVNYDDEIMPVKITDLYKINENQAVQDMVEAEAFLHVTHVLGEAWELEEDDHKRVVGRLFLYWHPKSNQSNEDYAQRVIEHIRLEIKRLLREDEESPPSLVDHKSGLSVGRHGSNEVYFNERGSGYEGSPRRTGLHRRRSGRKITSRSSHPLFHHDDSKMISQEDTPRVKRNSHGRKLCDSDYDGIFSQLEDHTIGQRTHSERCNIVVGGFGGLSPRVISDRTQPRGVRPNHGEARRWFEQAKNDFLAAKHCFDGGFHCNAASMCHQAAEKALKAALFVVYGSQYRGHGLIELASKVATRQHGFNDVVHITFELSRLKCNNDTPRYPDQWASPSIPASAYSKRDIRDMLSLTDEVLGHVSSLGPDVDLPDIT
ncbi:sacsin-like [Branchiostoma floridae x Branchiostoma belcheri]